MPTQAEASRIAEVLGGVPADYRDFVLAEDPWFSSQPNSIQAEIARLVGTGLKEPLEDLQAERKFSRRMAILGLAGGVTVALGLFYAAWLNHRYTQMRPEAYRYATVMYGQRDLAMAQAGIEVAKSQIIRLRALSDLAEAQYAGDPAAAAKMQAFLVDGVRYYLSAGQLFEDRMTRTKAILSAPEKAKVGHQVRDIITGQVVDLEAPDGGHLDMEEVRNLVRAQLRTEEFLKLAEALAKRERDINQVPAGSQWAQTARGAK